MRDLLKDWHADEATREAFAKLIESDVFQKAQALLQWLNLPRNDHQERPSAESIAYAAFSQKRLEGFFDYPAQLEMLANPPPLPNAEKPEPYSDEHVRSWAARHGYLKEETPDDT